MTRRLIGATLAAVCALSAVMVAQGGRPASPAGTAATEIGGKYDPKAAEPTYIGGKWIEITYGRPIKRGRDVLGGTGANYGKVANPDAPVWRAGANEATALHTDAELTVGSLKIPAGDYTLFVWLDPKIWKLIVNKQTGQEGTEYHEDQDLGRVPMIMSKPPAPLETYKITVASAGGNKGTLRLEWENVIAQVNFTAK